MITQNDENLCFFADSGLQPESFDFGSILQIEPALRIHSQLHSSSITVHRYSTIKSPVDQMNHLP
jgi:hypothetical protein